MNIHAEIRAALESATPGPWLPDKSGRIWKCSTTCQYDGVVAKVTDPEHPSALRDAHLIASAPTWLRELLDESDRMRAEASEADETWMRHVNELEGQIWALIHWGRTRLTRSRGLPATAASASEIPTSSPPTPATAGHTTTKPGASDGPQRMAFVVLAHRGGDNELHTYCAAVCDNETQARQSAEACEQYRGGKYSCSIWRFAVGVFDESEPVEILSETPIPGWKTAIQRVMDDQRRDNDNSSLRAALVRVIQATGGSATDEASVDFLCGAPDEVTLALVAEHEKGDPRDARAISGYHEMQAALQWMAHNGATIGPNPAEHGGYLLWTQGPPMPDEHKAALKAAIES